MDRVSNRIAQVYGYAVCFITVVVMLISIKGLVDAAIDLSDPIHADSGMFGRMGRPLTSFELYKMEARSPTPMSRGVTVMSVPPTQVGGATVQSRGDTLSDADLRRMYDAERSDVIENSRFHAIRSLVGNLLLITLSGVLFWIHWRWLRQRDALATV